MGGGNTAEQAREVLMDAAEHLFVTRGYRASTMEVIAREAGYSRTAIYRQFANRDELVAAMVQRTTQRHMVSILSRIPAGAGPVDLLVESLVIVASELVSDPLLNTIADQTADGTIASLIANDSGLTELVKSTVETVVADGTPFRPGLHPNDLAQFIIATALSFLMKTVPAVTDPAVARSYIETFILPAILQESPEPRRVF
ncbi:TetR/AcrR family transcriptional regulator [Mycolicibacterium sp. HK-90]|uniref:TetR/AcrR family transcriptional regulator n=1 Tax=Mycolicibacterium sp. HK-90 TaxID=3056937 RepID=UPI00265B1001|nr:TetR/AcrR family transcriptional regulator [Mycolicibacterium sp. HK-90]WKG04679.1 helix-turn-helix domain-containing protein [Mycolicibacterium sp. HK-90]